MLYKKLTRFLIFLKTRNLPNCLFFLRIQEVRYGDEKSGSTIMKFRFLSETRPDLNVA